MDADGSNPRNLTRHPANDNLPDWSPDGSQIAFDSDRGTRAINLYVMDTNGSHVKQLTHMRIEHLESHLTDNLWDNKKPYEWNPRLSVPPQQEMLPQYWGRLNLTDSGTEDATRTLG